MLRGRLLILGVGIVMLAEAAPAAAATITVNTTGDDQSPGDGQCSLRKAIQDVDSPGNSQTDCAPAAFGANTIVLGSGSYQLSFGGQLNVASTVASLTITGQGEHKTFVDARFLGNRIFMISGGATVAIESLTLSGGRAPDGSPGGSGTAGQPGANGGAILNQGNLSLIDSAITGSQAGSGGAGGAGAPATSGAGGGGGTGGAGGSGGAIYNGGNLSLEGVTLGSDDAGSGGAGGAGGQGASGGNGGNGGAAGDGGGVTNAGGTLNVADSTFRSDGAGNGGVGGAGASGSATTGGAGGTGGTGAPGGGLAADGGTLSVTNSTFASNTGGSGGNGGNGGAAQSSGAGAVGGNGGTGGAAGSGGGIGGSNPSSANVLQITAAGNNPGSPGGGGSAGTGATAGTAGATGAAGTGGGVFDQGSSITLQNSLLALNGGGNCGGAILDGGHNLGYGDASCPSTFAGGNPNLGALQDNGGPAPTISLQSGSAAIDQIPPSGANCPANDERGVPRPSGPKCDIGAYELAAPMVRTGAATDINKTFATLNAVVTPNAGSAAVSFQYGKTAKLGSKTPAVQESGVTPLAVAIRVLQLKANTTYFYRVVTVAMDGTSYGSVDKFTTSALPVLSGLRVTPGSFRSGASGTITYSDSLPARTQFVLLRCVTQKRGKCVRTTRAGSFAHVDKAGRNRVPLSGRGLRRGTYVLDATPHAVRVGQTDSARFTIT